MIEKPRFWENRLLVLGTIYLCVGSSVLFLAISKIRELAVIFVTYLPFSVPPDVLDRILDSAPSVFTTFVALVSSLAGLLFGVQWIFSGLSEILRSRSQTNLSGELSDKKCILGSLTSNIRPSLNGISREGSFWRRNILARWFPPVSHETINLVLRSTLKVACLMIFLWLIAALLAIAPSYVNRIFGAKVVLTTPYMGDLWILLTVWVVINLTIVASFTSFSRINLSSDSREFTVSGNGAIIFFLAFFEELCALTNPGNVSAESPSRFQTKGNGNNYSLATLFESYPLKIYRVANLLVYLLIPVVTFSIVWGFSRLINISAVPVSHYPLFLSRYLPEIVTGIAFSCLLIFGSFHFVRVIRTIFEISQFESSLISCQCNLRPPVNTETSSTLGQDDGASSGITAISDDGKWVELSGPEQDLIHWVKNPEGVREFSARISWARSLSESPSPWGPRFITSMRRDDEFNTLIARILKALSTVSFEIKEKSYSSSSQFSND